MPSSVLTSEHLVELREKMVFVHLMQENRSFDQTFGDCPDPNVDALNREKPPVYPDGRGNFFTARYHDLRQVNADPPHSTDATLHQINGGRMDGWIPAFLAEHPQASDELIQQFVNYYQWGSLKTTHMLAEYGTICDRFFASVPGNTWTNRFYAHSGTSRGMIGMPDDGVHKKYLKAWTHQNQDLIFTLMLEAGVDFAIYSGDIPQLIVMDRAREPFIAQHMFSMDKFYEDAAAGTLPSYVFIEPTYFGENQDDDHPPHDVNRGQKLQADVYNALRKAPQWSHTVLVFNKDEHGGLPDHVAPPRAPRPDDMAVDCGDFEFDILGVRIPVLVVSPLVTGECSHTVFDHTSILKGLCELFELDASRLGARTASEETNSFLSVLDSVGSPRIDAYPLEIVFSDDELLPPDIVMDMQASKQLNDLAYVTTFAKASLTEYFDHGLAGHYFRLARLVERIKRYALRLVRGRPTRMERAEQDYREMMAIMPKLAHHSRRHVRKTERRSC